MEFTVSTHDWKLVWGKAGNGIMSLPASRDVEGLTNAADIGQHPVRDARLVTGYSKNDLSPYITSKWNKLTLYNLDTTYGD